ncbi:MAG: prephenate dehydrogenase [Eubacteriales bacterium]
MLDKSKTILIVGLGLIGGSYARALTDAGYRVTAIDCDHDAIAYALSERMIENGATNADPALVSSADLIVFALYPHVFLDWIRESQHLFKPGVLLTDVTGVKGKIVEEVQSILRPDAEFIAAHPMAGREVSGVKNSTPAIFRGANYIVVPTEKNTQAAIETCRALGETLGFARVSELSPALHDEIIGFVSQLTHCIAIALMTCNQDEHLEEYTGDSFRDLTRIARINDEMWSELFLWNRDKLIEQIDSFALELGSIREMLINGDRDALRCLMRRATERRAKFDKK